MNLTTVLILTSIWFALVITMIIRNNRLCRKLRQERRHLTTACNLLWALADRAEPKFLYVPKDNLKPAEGGPAVTLNESSNGWTITAGTHHQEQVLRGLRSASYVRPRVVQPPGTEPKPPRQGEQP